MPGQAVALALATKGIINSEDAVSSEKIKRKQRLLLSLRGKSSGDWHLARVRKHAEREF